MDERRGTLVEFVAIALIAVALLAALVVLTVLGMDDGENVAAIRAAFTMTLGAVMALAYAARGGKPPDPPSPPAPLA